MEVKEISNEAIKDVLFEQAETNKRSGSSKSEQPKKKQRKQSSKKKSTKGDQDVDDADDKKSVSIENFNFKNIGHGTLILGQIKAINKLDITLALGDNLVGYIPITSISAQITKLLEEFDHESSEEEDEEEEKKKMMMEKLSLQSSPRLKRNSQN